MGNGWVERLFTTQWHVANIFCGTEQRSIEIPCKQSFLCVYDDFTFYWYWINKKQNGFTFFFFFLFLRMSLLILVVCIRGFYSRTTKQQMRYTFIYFVVATSGWFFSGEDYNRRQSVTKKLKGLILCQNLW